MVSDRVGDSPGCAARQASTAATSSDTNIGILTAAFGLYLIAVAARFVVSLF
jgi:hypothetical protein